MAKIIPFVSAIEETPVERIIRLMRLELAAWGFENPHNLDESRVAELLG